MEEPRQPARNSSRREFLKTTAKASLAVAGTSVILGGCAKKGDGSKLVRGKSPKEEILYQKSPQWNLYYSVAK